MSTNANKSCSIAFTLPISCQICLGKVKQPVICPNQHVFCQVCLEFWLSRSPHCPACRVQITKDNPCRPILGGLNEQQASTAEDFSNKDMRRTRVEVLFKDYENEIERLERQNELIKEENKMLTERLGKSTVSSDPSHQPGSVDAGRVKLLMQKLQDAGDAQDKLKREVKALREENRLLKEENGKTGIENQTLRMEVVSRSPRRYGRSTVVAMESQLEKQKKECSALNKALEKSDAYVEDLEKELDKYKKILSQQQQHHIKSSSIDHRGVDTGHHLKTKISMKVKKKPQLFGNDKDDEDGFDSSDSEYKVKSGGKPTDDTFDLELPSPMTKGSKAMSKLILETTAPSEDDLSFLKDRGTSLLNETEEETANETTLELPSPVQSAKKRLKFSEKNPSEKKGLITKRGDAIRLEGRGGLESNEYTQTGQIRSKPVQTGINTSMSGDMEDCMKLFEEAERKVEQRKGQVTSFFEGGDLLNKGNEKTSRDHLQYERSLSHTGSMGSLSGLIADNTLPSGSGLRKAGSSHSLASSMESASTLTMGHLATETPALKPALFSASLPMSKPNQGGIGIPGVPLGIATSLNGNFLSQSHAASNTNGNFLSQAAGNINGNFLSQPNTATSMGGNFLSQSSMSGNLQGKYSASNPFANVLSQESKKF